MDFNKIAILGLGLLGGSILKTIQKKANEQKREIELIGFGSQKSINYALEKKLIKKGFNSFNEEISNCDLIILCTPISIIIKQLNEVKPFLSSQNLITDVGSSKREILAKASELEIKNFIGSHPIAGSEKSGIENSSSNLFEEKLSIICHNDNYPLLNNHALEKEKLKEFWQFLGCNVQFMNSHDHDETYAYISHFPHLLSSLLMEQGQEFINSKKLKNSIYGSGFKSMTRLAKGNKDMWTDIFKTNTNYIQDAIKEFTKKLKYISKNIENKNWEEIEAVFQKNKNIREDID